jgi:nucleoside-diphosphate-sugar epimerase
MTKRVFVVTGGAGFIGSHLAERLLREGHTVRVLDNLLSGKRSTIEHLQRLNGDFTFYETSINDAAALPPLLQGAEVVFHLAALPSVQLSMDDPLTTHHHCATGTLTLLKAAHDQGVRRVVYAASASAYGDFEAPQQHEDLPVAPISPYGVAKLAGELYCRMFTAAYGLETVSLRYFNVFGARQDPTSPYASVIPKFVQALLRGERPIIFGDGQQTRDFTYVDNVVHGNLLAADAPDAAGKVMNMATGRAVSLLELYQEMQRILGSALEPQFVPARVGDIRHSCASITRAQELLDYAPLVSFEEGLARTVAWYREFKG